MTATKHIMVLVAGPARLGTGGDPATLVANVQAGAAAVAPHSRADHLPVRIRGASQGSEDHVGALAEEHIVLSLHAIQGCAEIDEP